MIHDRLKQKLADGKPVFGMSFRFSDPAIYEMIGSEWDFAWIDMQHGTIGVQHLLDIVRACDLVGMTSLIRLPNVPEDISFILDMDAGGVIIAQVHNVEEAQRAVAAAKFPPIGDRSYGGRRIIDRHSRLYTDKANGEQLLILMMEDSEAVADCETIAAIDGVDAMMLGPADLRLRLAKQMSGSIFEEDTLAVAKRVADAARKAGRHAMYFAPHTVEGIGQIIDLGFDMIVTSAESGYMTQGNDAMRAIIKEFERKNAGKKV